jgi:flagellar motor switch/type III secretory pathway protein FliN
LLSESREWKRYEQRRMGEKTSERNDGTVIAKCDRWAKPSQKINRPHWPHFHKSQTHDENTKMNMKKNNEETTKLNMNMNMNVKVKVNMNRKKNMKIDMDENLNEVELEHE